MATVRCFRSPFLIFLLLLVSCGNKETVIPQADLIRQHQIGNCITKSYDARYLPNQRKFYADLAADMAVKLGKDDFISGAFTSKYSVLSEAFPDSIPKFLKHYYHHSVANRDTLNIANAQGLYGDYFNALGQSDSAFAYYNQAKTNFEYKNDSVNIVYRLICMADIYNQFNDNNGLENVSTEALRFSNSKENIPTIYNNLGIASRRMQHFSDAIKYYQIVVKESKDSLHKAIALNNIAVVYNNSHDYKAAEKILSELKSAPFVLANPATKARVWCNLGYAQTMSGNPEGIRLLKASEMERLQLADSMGLVSTYIHLAEAYKSRPNLARQKALHAYTIATALNSPDDRLESLVQLAENSDNQSARQYYKIHLKISDSINGIRQAARNQFAKIRYDSRKANEENQKLKTERVQKALEFEKKKSQNITLFIILISFVVFGVMLYLLLRKQHKREKIREGYNAETRIAKKVHDELANDIFHTITFTETQDLADADKKETLLNHLDSIYSRSRDISRENNVVDTGPLYIHQLREMLSEYNSPQLNVIIHGLDGIDWETLPEEKKIATYRVLQELMVNMRKHSGAALAAIRVKKVAGKITVDYSDNGKGMPLDNAVFRNGLQNVENRINGIGGTVTFDSEPDKGLRISFSYPA